MYMPDRETPSKETWKGKMTYLGPEGLLIVSLDQVRHPKTTPRGYYPWLHSAVFIRGLIQMMPLLSCEDKTSLVRYPVFAGKEVEIV